MAEGVALPLLALGDQVRGLERAVVDMLRVEGAVDGIEVLVVRMAGGEIGVDVVGEIELEDVVVDGVRARRKDGGSIMVGVICVLDGVHGVGVAAVAVVVVVVVVAGSVVQLRQTVHRRVAVVS